MPSFSWMRFVRPGDLNAFFGLMLDNVTQLVILSGLLIGLFGFPPELLMTRILPGSAIGVLVGNLFYTALAVRLARRTGRTDVTAMPLGIETSSLFAFTLGITGPAYLATKDAGTAWTIGMAAMATVGLTKMALSIIGPAVRRWVPRAGLLGPIAAVAVLLIAFFPSLRIFKEPLVGMVSLAVVLLCLVGRVRFPLGLPAAFGAVLIGTGIHYLVYLLGWAGTDRMAESHWTAGWPLPTMGFLEGMDLVGPYLAVALPFAFAIVIGDIDVTESAAADGDEYPTRAIVFLDGLATLIGAVCGGTVQTTAYIGHPAYKRMGAGIGYTLGTGLFVGLGGVLGYLSFIVGLLPEAAVAPILIFVGLEITAQAFKVTPAPHHRAVAIAFLPVTAYLVVIQLNSLMGAAGLGPDRLTGEMAVTYRVLILLSNGFIITSLLWATFLSFILNRRLTAAAAAMLIAGGFTLFGVIHSPFPDGRLFWAWEAQSSVFTLATGYWIMAGLVWLAALRIPPPAAQR
jgi:AGZA family xanthine/uracil permease-like MFS transporter